jgi:multiple sugar transport system permease protein
MTRRAHPLGVVVLIAYACVSLAPIAWLAITSIKHPTDIVSPTPRIIPTAAESQPAVPMFRVSLGGYRRVLTGAGGPIRSWPDLLSHPLVNSLLIAVTSTIASTFLGALAAYGFSRFRVPGAKDWLFFILSTRLLPPLAVAVPISWMYYRTGLFDTRFGLVLLYTCFNLSFSTWLMKAFIDEIPTAYEEAALLDGYTRLGVFVRIVLPQATAGMLATAVFCLITAWNEFAFALTLTSEQAVTMPVRLNALSRVPGTDTWSTLSAGAVLFMLPVVVFSLLMRKHLLRGVTFGAIKG